MKCFALAILLALSLPLSAQKSQPIPANQLPWAQEDRQIDFLGANVHSQADAETYVNAIFAKYKLDETSVPGLSPLEHRLAVAEYASLTTDPTKRVPESQLVDAFNKLMREWGEPKWTRISREDFHRFHKIKAATLIPYSVSRDAEANVAYTCRPVEAIYLLGLLAIDRAMQYNFKSLTDLPDASIKQPMIATGTYSLRPAPQTAENRIMFTHDREYQKARSAWWQKHPDTAQEIGRQLDALRID